MSKRADASFAEVTAKAAMEGHMGLAAKSLDADFALVNPIPPGNDVDLIVRQKCIVEALCMCCHCCSAIRKIIPILRQISSSYVGSLR